MRKSWDLNFLRKTEVERSEIQDSEVDKEALEWWAEWRRCGGRLFHKTGAEWKNDIRNFVTRSDRRTIECGKRWGMNRMVRCEWDKRAGIRRMTSFKRFVSERTLYLIFWFIVSQWRDLRIGKAMDHKKLFEQKLNTPIGICANLSITLWMKHSFAEVMSLWTLVTQKADSLSSWT